MISVSLVPSLLLLSAFHWCNTCTQERADGDDHSAIDRIDMEYREMAEYPMWQHVKVPLPAARGRSGPLLWRVYQALDESGTPHSLESDTNSRVG